MYSWVSQVVSFLQVSPPNPCICIFSPSYVPHAPPISFFSMLSPLSMYYLLSPWSRVLREKLTAPTSHFPKIHRIILPSTPGSPKSSPSFKFPHQNPVYASPLSHTRYMPHPSNSPRFYHHYRCIPTGIMLS